MLVIQGIFWDTVGIEKDAITILTLTFTCVTIWGSLMLVGRDADDDTYCG